MDKLLVVGTITFQIGAWVLIVLLPTARSFSIANHHTHTHTHIHHRAQQLSFSPYSSSPFSNTLTHDINTNTNTNINTTPTRIGSTHHQPYQNHDISRDQSQFDDESLDDAYFREEFTTLHTDTSNRRFESSMEYGWRGLKEIYSSPSLSAVAVTNDGDGNDSDSDGNGGSNFNILNGISVLQPEETSGVAPSSPSPTPRDLEEEMKIPSRGFASFSGVSSPPPLILRPKDGNQGSSSPDFLRSFLEKNRQWIEQRILEYGAVVFRGFGLESETTRDKNSVDETIRAFDPDCNNMTLSSSLDIRHRFEYYFVPTTEGKEEYPSSITTSHPGLNCTTAPKLQLKDIGRETRLTDFRKIYRDLPPKLRTKLINKKLLYRRTHHALAIQTLPSFANKKMVKDSDREKSWFQLFGTTNKRHVERMCQQINANFVNEFLSEPFQLHPKTHERIWFRLAHVFHWTAVPAELFANFRRTKNVRILGHALRLGARSLWKYGIQRRRTTPVEVTFGDGTPISIWEMHQIRKAIQRNTVPSRLQQGDILMIDGLSMGLK